MDSTQQDPGPPDPDTQQEYTGVPDPEQQPVMSVPEAGGHVGLGRSSSYAAADRGEIPTIRLGRKMVVPTAQFRALLGLR